MILFLLVSWVSLSLCWAAPQATVGSTTLIGLDESGSDQDFFGGIPYAQPPIGSSRFKAPVLTTTLAGSSFDASKFGPPCLQLPAQTGMSEDCLTLNILRPTGTTASSKLPVLVWIYGGGFSDGMASSYNGSLILRQSVSRGTPVIYVDLNYRLGVLGFPTGSEAQQRGALNLGLKDQLAALQWVHTNIGNFGGDNTKVTVFGQSAGAISIADLFLNSKLETLIRGAIMESGSQASVGIFTAESGDSLWTIFAQSVPSCKTAAQGNTIPCLQQASVTDILAAASFAGGQNPQEFAFVPVIDGNGGVIPELPSTMLSAGSFSRIPFIAGTCLDDGTIFTSQSVNSDQSILAYLAKLSSTLNTANTTMSTLQTLFLNIIVQAYSDNPADGSPYNTGSQTFGLSPFFKKAASIVGDAAFQATRRAWITAAASAGVTTYGYLFTEPQANTYAGVLHASELNYVFGLPQLTGPAEAATFSTQMIDYWLSFVVAGNPNDGRGSSRTPWPTYNTNNPQILQLNGNNLTAIPDNYRQLQIELINQVPSIFGH